MILSYVLIGLKESHDHIVHHVMSRDLCMLFLVTWLVVVAACHGAVAEELLATAPWQGVAMSTWSLPATAAWQRNSTCHWNVAAAPNAGVEVNCHGAVAVALHAGVAAWQAVT